MSSRPAWSTHQVPGQPGVHSKTLLSKNKNSQAVVAHAFNSSTWETDQAVLCEFGASLVYKWSSRSACGQEYTVRPCLKQGKWEGKEREKASQPV